MKTYRIWFLDWTTKSFLESGDPLRYRDYEAKSASGALRSWLNHYYGYSAERIEKLPVKENPGKVET